MHRFCVGRCDNDGMNHTLTTEHIEHLEQAEAAEAADLADLVVAELAELLDPVRKVSD